MKQQHTKPCRECPWKRTSCRGWLGPETGYPQVYINAAHGEEIIECHTPTCTNAQALPSTGPT
jgi:hypothetical protein